MSSQTISPTTLDGIKRLAKSFRSARGIKHAQALDEAARAAKFQNFRHAQAQLGRAGNIRGRAKQDVFITAYWRDREQHTEGRETLRIQLNQRWSDLLPGRSLTRCRGLGDYNGQAIDHLVCNVVLARKSSARRSICFAARTLQFIDATGLRPARKHRSANQPNFYRDPLPAGDHDSDWTDRHGDVHVIVDEPYDRAVEGRMQARAEWAARNSYRIAAPSWPGMYNPDGGCRIFLIAPVQHRAFLESAIAALDRLPSPVVEPEWSGESGPYRPVYLSPSQAQAGASPRPPTDLRVRRNYAHTRPYAGPLTGNARRPNGRMPIEVHEEIGALIAEVMEATSRRPSVHSKLSAVRCELDEWIQREYDGSELDDQRFFDVYYGAAPTSQDGADPETQNTRYRESLQRAEQRLAAHYPDSPPLRALLSKLRAAARSLEAWTPAVPRAARLAKVRQQ